MTTVHLNNLTNTELLPKSDSLLRLCETSHLALSALSRRKYASAMTRTRYLKLSEPERESALKELYVDNLNRLDGALSFVSSTDSALPPQLCSFQ